MTGQSKQVRLSPWGSAVAGASGAVLANAAVYPLDLYVTVSLDYNEALYTDLSFVKVSRPNSKSK